MLQFTTEKPEPANHVTVALDEKILHGEVVVGVADRDVAFVNRDGTISLSHNGLPLAGLGFAVDVSVCKSLPCTTCRHIAFD